MDSESEKVGETQIKSNVEMMEIENPNESFQQNNGTHSEISTLNSENPENSTFSNLDETPKMEETPTAENSQKSEDSEAAKTENSDLAAKIESEKMEDDCTNPEKSSEKMEESCVNAEKSTESETHENTKSEESIFDVVKSAEISETAPKEEQNESENSTDSATNTEKIEEISMKMEETSEKSTETSEKSKDSSEVFSMNDVDMNDLKQSMTEIVDKDLSALLEEEPPLGFNCGECGKNTENSPNFLTFEMISFCDDICLKKYQEEKLKFCTECNGETDSALIGKYINRTLNEDFSHELSHFCNSRCQKEFNKCQKLTCLFCQKCINEDSKFLAAVGQLKDQYRHFCNEECLDKYRKLSGKKKLDAFAIGPAKNICPVCNTEKEIHAKLKDETEKITEFCSVSCMNSSTACKVEKCALCNVHFKSAACNLSAIFDKTLNLFCSPKCYQFFYIEKSCNSPCSQCNFSKTDLSMVASKTKGLKFCCTNCFYLHQLRSADVNKADLSAEPRKPRVLMRNKGTMKRPHLVNKGVTCRPAPIHKEVQTEKPPKPALVPIPVPIYVPLPLAMYQRPYPVPVPTPLPVPVPVFVPTTRNSTRGVKKFMKKIKSKLPSNVFEAQILEMAGELGDGLDSDDSVYEGGEEYADEDIKDDIVKQEIPREDVENVIKAGNIVPKPLPQVTPDACPSPSPFMHNRRSPTPRVHENNWHQMRRYQNINRNRGGSRPQQSRPRQRPLAETNPALAALSLPPKERPDAKHHLKFTYGVNAWRHWVVGKNAELEKARAQGRYMKPFETDILKLRADELNYTLCMFVKEVRKPNGDHYASDSILYLTLGIQEYLFENGRIDNIFTDMYYEPFTSALHEVIKNFKLPVNELGYFVTRIEEEHLWESKQLGAHSPQVLLNTLIYFNAKYFMMKTMDDHTKLSFTHIMKHWKKGGTATPATKHPPVPGEKRTTLLRYYPPAHLKGHRHDDRKCFEQQELPDNPMRCPVKLYEFYLTHCPDSAKSKNDLFYLQPERSCVPDSPVWYSNQQLNPFQLEKMLARILMVREVQEHMLADASHS